MKLIGIVGMPGSGKSELFKAAEFASFDKFDNVLANWEKNEQRIRELIQDRKSVLVSDIEFCNLEFRHGSSFSDRGKIRRRQITLGILIKKRFIR